MGGRVGGGSHGHHRDQLVGRVIDIHGKSYTFEQRLGAGGFGAVYSARSSHGNHVAIKVVDLRRVPGFGETLAESYLNEVRHLEKLRRESDHVVQIYDFDFDPRHGRAYIVMELGDDNLASAIDRLNSMGYGHRRGRHASGTFVNPVIRKEIWRQMVTIVKTLTENNIVHMDLKPDNLIVFGRTLKIADLGISKKPEMLGEPGVGTPYFSAPEIMQARPGSNPFYGPKADVWSLGAILYYMTYGVPPQYSPRAADPPPGQPHSRDPALVDVLRRTLLLNPHERADIFSLSRHSYTTR